MNEEGKRENLLRARKKNGESSKGKGGSRGRGSKAQERFQKAGWMQKRAITSYPFHDRGLDPDPGFDPDLAH